MKVLEVGFIHDLVCSWCPLGHARLAEAIEVLRSEQEIRVRYLPFQLNPQLSEQGISIRDYFLARHGWSETRLLQYQQHVTQIAIEAGVIIDFNRRRYYYPTANAHFALLISSKFGLQSEMRALLQHAYFAEGQNISQKSLLTELAVQAGIPAASFEQCWQDTRLQQEMSDDMALIQQLQVSTVPALLLEGRVITAPPHTDLLIRLLQRTAMIQQQTGAANALYSHSNH